MILEDLGVKAENFMELQTRAVAEARTIHFSIEQFRSILRIHKLGISFSLEFVLRGLEKLGFDLNDRNGQWIIDDPFLSRTRRFAMNHVLRDIKHDARIPIPDSWLLVGVADEGPAYQKSGHENIFCLKAGQIYGILYYILDSSLLILCSLRPEPGRRAQMGQRALYNLPQSCCAPRGWYAYSPCSTWIYVHFSVPVQSVFAVGKPPEDKFCLFGHLKNVVVLPSVGKLGE